jgi:hypothetical protein
MSPTMRPKVKHSAPPSEKMARIWTKLASGVGFSYGCAALALKKPPPLVPSILMATCDEAGPIAIFCLSVVLSSITGLPCASLTGWPSGPFFASW